MFAAFGWELATDTHGLTLTGFLQPAAWIFCHGHTRTHTDRLNAAVGWKNVNRMINFCVFMDFSVFCRRQVFTCFVCVRPCGSVANYLFFFVGVGPWLIYFFVSVSVGPCLLFQGMQPIFNFQAIDPRKMLCISRYQCQLVGHCNGSDLKIRK